MESNEKRIQKLFQKYLDNSLTSEEYSEFWSLLNAGFEENNLSAGLKELWNKSALEQISLPGDEWKYKMQRLREDLNGEHSKVMSLQKRGSWLYNYKWAAAVVLLVMLSGTVYLWVNRTTKTDIVKLENSTKELNNDSPPGSDKAVLTLADGSKIVLDSAGDGMLAQQGNTKIIKQGDGQLVYNAATTESKEIAYNTLVTPRGGQYKLVLPDGSKVWLNAASSLKYPTSFMDNERKVEITGEAYFEVAKNPSRPFRVFVNSPSGDGGMEVEVLGTHFNVNAYEDEALIRTTLLEGSIKINRNNTGSLLKPGQQAQLSKAGEMKLIHDADVEEAIAWKEGKFQFENADINTVMRQVTRWYDLDVQYKGTISKHFGGTISRNVNLSQVLDMLRQTGEVKFSIEGKKIIVMP